VLERLGSPEVVAAAAHEEAGTRFTPPVRSDGGKFWPIAGIVGGVVLVLFLCAFFAFFATSGRDSSVEGPPAPAVTAPAPTAS
jgi:hypothetical protein